MNTTAMSPEDVEQVMASAFPAGFGQRPASKFEDLVKDWGLLDQTHVDLATSHVDSGQTLGARVVTVKALRHTHHRLAQLLAIGTDEGVAGKLCNYTANRVSVLKADPAFQELLAYYADEAHQEWRNQWGDFVSASKGLTMDLLGHLQQMLDENPERFTPAETREAIKVLADRTGHAPVQKSLNVNVNTDMATRMQAARARLQDHRKATANG